MAGDKRIRSTENAIQRGVIQLRQCSTAEFLVFSCLISSHKKYFPFGIIRITFILSGLISDTATAPVSVSHSTTGVVALRTV